MRKIKIKRYEPQVAARSAALRLRPGRHLHSAVPHPLPAGPFAESSSMIKLKIKCYKINNIEVWTNASRPDYTSKRWSHFINGTDPPPRNRGHNITSLNQYIDYLKEWAQESSK